MNVTALLLATFLVAATALADESPAEKGTRVYPHTDKGNCEQCHEASEADLNSWFTFPSTKRKLKKDPTSLCQQCHGVEFGHGVGLVPKKNDENLPLDADGKIACAITCHNMHVKSSDDRQHKFHLRYVQVKLCLSCHNK